MELRARLPVLAAAAVVALALAGMAGRAGAAVYMTREQALAEAFPGARLERRVFVLRPEQVTAVERRARARVESKLPAAWLAWHGDSLVGTAFFESRIVRTMPGVFMIVVAPDTSLRRVDVLTFHEPSDYRPSARWLDQFPHRRLNDRLRPEGDIRTLAGASLTTRAITDCARLDLALYEMIVSPALAPRPGRGGPR